MWRLTLVSVAVMLGAAVLPSAVCSEVKEQRADLFKDCREAGTIPAKLKETYAAFAAAASKGKVEAILPALCGHRQRNSPAQERPGVRP